MCARRTGGGASGGDAGRENASSLRASLIDKLKHGIERRTRMSPRAGLLGIQPRVGRTGRGRPGSVNDKPVTGNGNSDLHAKDGRCVPCHSRSMWQAGMVIGIKRADPRTCPRFTKSFGAGKSSSSADRSTFSGPTGKQSDVLTTRGKVVTSRWPDPATFERAIFGCSQTR